MCTRACVAVIYLQCVHVYLGFYICVVYVYVCECVCVYLCLCVCASVCVCDEPHA